MSRLADRLYREFPIEVWTWGPDSQLHHLALHAVADGLRGYRDGVRIGLPRFVVLAMSSPRETNGQFETIPRPMQKDNAWVSGRFVNHQGKRHLTLIKRGAARPEGYLDGDTISLEAVAYLALTCPLWDRQMRLVSAWTARSPTASPAA